MVQEIALIITPAFFGGLAALFRFEKVHKFIIILASAIHFFLTFTLTHGTPDEHTFLGADDLSFIFLVILTLLFAASSLNSIAHIISTNSDKYHIWYTPSMLWLLSSMTGVVLSRHLGLTWVFIEATTLSSAPLIHYSRSRDSLEAVWKYLFVCSVGIALAFVSVIGMIAASRPLPHSTLFIDDLIKNASALSPLWLKISFVFALVGYGTKMGLAPFHTCHPDADTLAPSPASALFSGTLSNCAFLSILRHYQIMARTGEKGFAEALLLTLGVLSLLVAAVYVLRVTNFKRMLAYSSIEHMGILTLGVYLGGIGHYAVMLHALCHSLTKSILFLLTGNFLKRYKTIDSHEISGAIGEIPVSSWLLITGILSLLGCPPFGTFISEFILISQMVKGDNWVVLVVFAFFLTIIFYAMVKTVVSMTFSQERIQDRSTNNTTSEILISIIPQGIFIVILIILGIHIPEYLQDIFTNASLLLTGELSLLHLPYQVPR
jgi:hydrogenase-4 component F